MKFSHVCCAACLLGLSPSLAAERSIEAAIHLRPNNPAIEVSPLLYGIFFEDINYAADGGLYAEMVQNRSFDYYSTGGAGRELHPLTAWSPVQEGGRTSALRVEIYTPVHPQNPNYCLVTLKGGTGKAGLANAGFGGGLSVRANAKYDLSLYARAFQGTLAPLNVALQSPEGEVLASAELPTPGGNWTRHETTLTPSRDERKARLVITTAASGTLGLDMVSLFPQDTFKGRKNGMRKDLGQAIADLKPALMRFPGGCLIHGSGLDNAYRWKETVGETVQRRPKWNRWGYHQTMGLGYFEYFQFCEDIGAEPLPILPAGVSCGFTRPFEIAREPLLSEMIQDAIDLVEFANGGADTTWGKLRAQMGHPEPFNLKYVGLGNEEHDTTSFRELFPRFVKALRQRHPEIKIVGTSGLGPGIPLFDLMKSTGVEISDEHYYESPEWFINNRHRFDKLERGATKIFVGEYASRGNKLFNAIAEAVYLTGIERNSDYVVMGAYAPLLARYNFTQWKDANLIWFDNDTVVRTPNYHVQRMFATRLGDRLVPTELKFNSASASGPEPVLGISTTLQTKSGKLHVKIANPMTDNVKAAFALEGNVSENSQAELLRMSGGKDDANDLNDPDRIAPKTTHPVVGKSFTLDIPAMSVQVLTLNLKGQ